MSETGIYAYDLAGSWCEECGQAKSFRLWPGVLTGCKTCDEAITRHRCTKLPDLADRAPGQTWECPDCGSLWKLAEEETGCPDCCGECGHTVTRRHWDLLEEGDRISSAPRQVPRWTPFRDAPFRNANVSCSQPGPPRSCYTMPDGSAVHVKPECRCKR